MSVISVKEVSKWGIGKESKLVEKCDVKKISILSICWMRLSMIWRVMKIEISIILQIVRKPNPITVSFVIDFQFKNKVKHDYLDRC